MPTNKQRREAARRHLERQVVRREQREATRKKITLYSSIGGTILAVAVIVVLVLVIGGGNDNKKADDPTVSTPAASTPAASPTPAKAATGKSVSYLGVTVKGATDLTGYPVVTSKSSTNPKSLEVKDLVVGKGATATSTSTVSVQYVGVLYKDGTQFDSSWTGGTPAQFSLNGGVIAGFQQGIGGTATIAPMKVGGRRLIIMPASLGYGDKANGSIPANSALVFVVDLKTAA